VTILGITLRTVPGTVREVVRNATLKGILRSVLSPVSRAMFTAKWTPTS